MTFSLRASSNRYSGGASTDGLTTSRLGSAAHVRLEFPITGRKYPLRLARYVYFLDAPQMHSSPREHADECT